MLERMEMVPKMEMGQVLRGPAKESRTPSPHGGPGVAVTRRMYVDDYASSTYCMRVGTFVECS